MRLPFTEAQFLDVFVAYNTAVWPVLVLLWIATFLVTIRLVAGRSQSVTVSALAALHWAWSGVVYHALFFSRVNPAAWIFAALFVAQAVGFSWFVISRNRLGFALGATVRQVLAVVFLCYSVAYPFLIVFTGFALPGAPGFAVPCPTTLFTAGLLLAAVPPVPRWLFVVPIVWSFIGGSAALLFGMTPDLMLFVAGVSMVVYGLFPARLARVRSWDTAGANVARR